MISTRNILFIFGIFVAQLYIFTQVQSVELRFALAVVAIFQIWKKEMGTVQENLTDWNVPQYGGLVYPVI